MEHMASRPFTKLCVDVSRNEASKDGGHTDGPISSVSRSLSGGGGGGGSKKVKKANKLERGGSVAAANRTRVMPVAVEPLSNSKTAIVTCLLKLPQGNSSSTPKGSSPFVLCSAYVSVSSGLVSYVSGGGGACDEDEEAENGGSGRVNPKTVQ